MGMIMTSSDLRELPCNTSLPAVENVLSLLIEAACIGKISQANQGMQGILLSFVHHHMSWSMEWFPKMVA